MKFNCPTCEQRIEAQDDWVGRCAICPTCQHNLIIPPAAAPNSTIIMRARQQILSPGPSNSSQRVCTFCNATVLATAAKCRCCGEWIDSHNPQLFSLDLPRPKQILVTAVILAAIAVIGILAGLVNLNKPQGLLTLVGAVPMLIASSRILLPRKSGFVCVWGLLVFWSISLIAQIYGPPPPPEAADAKPAAVIMSVTFILMLASIICSSHARGYYASSIKDCPRCGSGKLARRFWPNTITCERCGARVTLD